MKLKELSDTLKSDYPIDAEIYSHFLEEFRNYESRQKKGVDVLGAYLSLIRQITTTKFENPEIRRYIDLLLAKIYRQIGIFYQTKKEYKLANDYLDLSLNIRRIYCSPEEGFTRFQKYMNAHFAALDGDYSLIQDLFHDDGDEEEQIQSDKINLFSRELEELINDPHRDYTYYIDESETSDKDCAGNFISIDEKYKKEPWVRDKGLQWNNIGYVYQTAAVMAYQNDPYKIGIGTGDDKSREYVTKALENYKHGLELRLNNGDKDFRLYSQTLVRISQCLLFRINTSIPDNDKIMREYFKILIRSVSFVEQYYLKHPVEKHRLIDLRNLIVDLSFCALKHNHSYVNENKTKQNISVDEVKGILDSLGLLMG